MYFGVQISPKVMPSDRVIFFIYFPYFGYENNDITTRVYAAAESLSKPQTRQSDEDYEAFTLLAELGGVTVYDSDSGEYFFSRKTRMITNNLYMGIAEGGEVISVPEEFFKDDEGTITLVCQPVAYTEDGCRFLPSGLVEAYVSYKKNGGMISFSVA